MVHGFACGTCCLELNVGLELHTSPSTDTDEHQRLAGDHLSGLRSTTLPAFTFGDYNTPFKWAGEDAVPYADVGKTRLLLDCAREFDFAPVPPVPEQRNQPTSRPRRKGVVGNQIDAIFAKRGRVGFYSIATDSCYQTGTHHDALCLHLRLQKTGHVVSRVRTGKHVIKEPVKCPQYVNQDVLVELARRHTCPPQSTAYDSQQAKALFRTAKRTKDRQDWKRPFARRRQDRDTWET